MLAVSSRMQSYVFILFLVMPHNIKQLLGIYFFSYIWIACKRYDFKYFKLNINVENRYITQHGTEEKSCRNKEMPCLTWNVAISNSAFRLEINKLWTIAILRAPHYNWLHLNKWKWEGLIFFWELHHRLTSRFVNSTLGVSNECSPKRSQQMRLSYLKMVFVLDSLIKSAWAE